MRNNVKIINIFATMIKVRIEEGYGSDENLNHTKKRRTTICTKLIRPPSPKKGNPVILTF